MVAAAFGGGDSGAPVYQVKTGTNVKLVGILYGGDPPYYFYSKINRIERADEMGNLGYCAPPISC
jgi:V8-like Glu-specific endopeptidase